MKAFGRWIVVITMYVCTSAFANTFTADFSDTWWNENESGWGVSVNHQREIAFMTFFVYGNGGKVVWYTGQTSIVGQNADGSLIFTGPVYEFTGPSLGSAFNPAMVKSRVAGNVIFAAFLDRATLSYTIDGVSESKVVSRQTIRRNDLSGAYLGAIKHIQSGCRGTGTDGDSNNNAEIYVTNTSNTFTMLLQQSDGRACNFVGDYSQTGRLGRSVGKYTCSGGVIGTYDFFELDANTQAISGRFLTNNSECTRAGGRFAGMKK